MRAVQGSKFEASPEGSAEQLERGPRGSAGLVQEFDETDFFRSIAACGSRALLIGRRALIALGIPVLTADYDFWLHIDDIATFNESLAGLGLFPTRTPQEARERGRYALENDERVDVLVARSAPTVDGVRVAFDELWPRRQALEIAAGVTVAVPALDESRSLIRWFRRRYPTPAERLAYARRAYSRWQAGQPKPGSVP